MIGSMTDTEVLDFLRANFAGVDERFDSIERHIEELGQRVSRLETEAERQMRREFLRWCGRFAAVTPPAMMTS